MSGDVLEIRRHELSDGERLVRAQNRIDRAEESGKVVTGFLHAGQTEATFVLEDDVVTLGAVVDEGRQEFPSVNFRDSALSSISGQATTRFCPELGNPITYLDDVGLEFGEMVPMLGEAVFVQYFE